MNSIRSRIRVRARSAYERGDLHAQAAWVREFGRDAVKGSVMRGFKRVLESLFDVRRDRFEY